VRVRVISGAVPTATSLTVHGIDALEGDELVGVRIGLRKQPLLLAGQVGELLLQQDMIGAGPGDIPRVAASRAASIAIADWPIPK